MYVVEVEVQLLAVESNQDVHLSGNLKLLVSLSHIDSTRLKGQDLFDVWSLVVYNLIGAMTKLDATFVPEGRTTRNEDYSAVLYLVFSVTGWWNHLVVGVLSEYSYFEVTQ